MLSVSAFYGLPPRQLSEQDVHEHLSSVGSVTSNSMDDAAPALLEAYSVAELSAFECTFSAAGAPGRG
jgi:hypothetical protein